MIYIDYAMRNIIDETLVMPKIVLYRIKVKFMRFYFNHSKQIFSTPLW